jgi:5-methyltetrahydropteroyltriglutamate--homocysteine methyltransferase
MKASTDRVLTTHVGSLPRPDDLLQMLTDWDSPDRMARDARIAAAIVEAVGRQLDAGIDVVSDGEMGKAGFFSYPALRLTGFNGQAEFPVMQDVLDFPEVADRMLPARSGASLVFPSNDGQVRYFGEAELTAQLAAFRAAVDGTDAVEAFVPAASPGIIADTMPSTHYGDRADYLSALAEAMRQEYRQIVDAGFLLQIDSPDLASSRTSYYGAASVAEFRDIISANVAALNYALDGISTDSLRMHVCWGNNAGPHHRDIELRDIIDIVYRANVGAYVIEGANPRHEHEWAVFRDVPLPEGKILIPGVIDSCTNFIEHPELVAQRIVRYAEVVGRERVIAGVDCGFESAAGFSPVVPSIAYAKLAALVQGAELATAQLWR